MHPQDERTRVIEKLLHLDAEDVEKVLIFMAGMDAGHSLQRWSGLDAKSRKTDVTEVGDDNNTS